MDASTYLRRKKEAMAMYVNPSRFVDAGFRTEMLGKAAGSLTYISPNTKQTPIDPCTTDKVPFTGSASAQPVKVPGGVCCVQQHTNPTTTPCCPMIYMSTGYVSDCKHTPYYGTRVQQAAAEALHTSKDCCQ